MRIAPGSIAIALLATVVPATARSQTPYAGCVDRLHRPVATIPDESLPSAASAYIDNGRPVIYWNAKRLTGASETARTFIYLHECAHHVLGHLYKANDRRWENEADCWAIQHLVDGGAMRGHNVVALERELADWPADPMHLGGRQLVQSLQHCIAIRTDHRAWTAVLDGFLEASRDSFVSIRRSRVPGAAPPVYETTLDPPGTYDCMIRDDASVVCSIFEGRTPSATAKQYHRIAGILRDWMQGNWTVEERPAPGTPDPLQLYGMDRESGTQISLIATDHFELFIVFQPASRGS